MATDVLFIGGPADGQFQAMTYIHNGMSIFVPNLPKNSSIPDWSAAAGKLPKLDAEYIVHDINAPGERASYVAIPVEQSAGGKAGSYIMSRLLNSYAAMKHGDDQSSRRRQAEQIGFLKTQVEDLRTLANAADENRVAMFRSLVFVVRAAGGEVKVDLDVVLEGPDLVLHRQDYSDGTSRFYTQNKRKGTN